MLYIHTYIHTYINTYIHKYIHTYIHTHLLQVPTFAKAYDVAGAHAGMVKALSSTPTALYSMGADAALKIWHEGHRPEY